MRIAVCCIIKQENRYLREWVSYYEGLGFDKIFLYDNNDVGGEDPNAVIQDKCDSGRVELIDYKGRTLCQEQAYQECFDTYRYDYDWILFVDSDEFFTLNFNTVPTGMTVKDWLKMDIFTGFNMIHVNWLCYGDNGLLTDDGRDTVERFTKPASFTSMGNTRWPINCHVKSFIKGIGNDGSIKWENNTHIPLYTEGIRCCNSVGEEIIAHLAIASVNFDTATAYVRHYVSKTITEFLYHKFSRGYADIIKDKSYKGLVGDLLFFFSINEVTADKIDIVNNFIDAEFSKNVFST